MAYKINSKPSNSGKLTVYFPTIDGMRISRTNYGRKWEAENLAKAYIKDKAA